MKVRTMRSSHSPFGRWMERLSVSKPTGRTAGIGALCASHRQAGTGWHHSSSNDDQFIYIRLNPRTHTPFGLGRLEVAFEAINAFLGAHRYATKLASNSVVEYALWLQGLTPEHHERLIRWWQDEIEGTGRVPILSAENKPEVLRFRRRYRRGLAIAVAGILAAYHRRRVRSSSAVPRSGARSQSFYGDGNGG